eukprot:COSAG06_NODE_15089_length_1098_cov_1.362362_2_plen_50_part_00
MYVAATPADNDSATVADVDASRVGGTSSLPLSDMRFKEAIKGLDEESAT